MASQPHNDCLLSIVFECFNFAASQKKMHVLMSNVCSSQRYPRAEITRKSWIYCFWWLHKGYKAVWETPFQDTGQWLQEQRDVSLLHWRSVTYSSVLVTHLGCKVDKSGQKEWAERRGSGGKRWSVYWYIPLEKEQVPLTDSCDFFG